MYNQILFTNIIRILEQKGMTKTELAVGADISVSWLSDLTRGHANPTLKVMEKLAIFLETPLTELLEHTDLDPVSLALLSEGRATKSLPKGYKRVMAIVTDHQAFIIRKWDAEARSKLEEMKTVPKD
ncbi:helix-turn-helix domain-containing protein [Aeromonas caviae]|nr:helix-turn-helix domain-containing protein [Aeromonas caviae]MDH1400101.1 helix-turn-helix domain-containing protein [Aeromonas caviae]